MKKLTRRAFMRTVLLGLTVGFIRKFLLAQGLMETVCDTSFWAQEKSTVKAFLESTGLQISGRSEHADELLNGHFFVDAINDEERLFVFTVDDHLFWQECVDHYHIYPKQRLTVYCL